MAQPTTVTDTSFDTQVLKSDLTVLALFWASWNSAGQAAAQTLAHVAETLAGKVKVAHININQAPNTAAVCNVLQLPTVVVFKNSRPIATLTGVPSADEVLAAVKPYLIFE